MQKYNKFWAAVATLLAVILLQFGLELDESSKEALVTIVVTLGSGFVWGVRNTA